MLDVDAVVRELSTKLELPEREARLYVLLAQQPPVTLTEIVALEGMGAQETESAVQALVERGMVIRRPGSAEAFEALHPRFALTNLFKLFEARVTTDLRARRAAADRLSLMLIPLYEQARHPKV